MLRVECLGFRGEACGSTSRLWRANGHGFGVEGVFLSDKTRTQYGRINSHPLCGRLGSGFQACARAKYTWY